jgi:hypothetical protein
MSTHGFDGICKRGTGNVGWTVEPEEVKEAEPAQRCLCFKINLLLGKGRLTIDEPKR